jgi:DNA repair ATPase RecN
VRSSHPTQNYLVTSLPQTCQALRENVAASAAAACDKAAIIESKNAVGSTYAVQMMPSLIQALQALTKLRAKCETLETAKNELAAVGSNISSLWRMAYTYSQSVKGQADVIKNLTAEFEALQVVSHCTSSFMLINVYLDKLPVDRVGKWSRDDAGDYGTECKPESVPLFGSPRTD